ncbi:MAG TPA: TetR/AcrR family transcriptional regulator [Alphaproteobacteria bacterium]
MSARSATVPSDLAAPADKPARERIFNVAMDLFYRQGIRAVGVEAIVAAAGATKMSLYRNFPSKDALVEAYLKSRNETYWQWWDEVVARHPGQPRQQIIALFKSVAGRSTRPNYRGCPFTNAATEFPERGHPGRAVAAANKAQLRDRLRGLAAEAGAREPERLGDQLFLLMEGAYASGQIMGPSGPALHLAEAADALIAAQVG